MATPRNAASVAGGVPDAPMALVANVTGNTVMLAWSAAPPTDLITSYIIEAGSLPGTSNLAVFPTGTAATTFFAQAVPSGTFYVRVRAANGLGTSNASNEITVVVGSGGCAPPGAPSGLTVTTNSAATLGFSWTGGPGAASHRIEAGSGPGSANLANSNVGAVTTLTVNGVSAGTYYIRVRSENACGTSAPSNEVVVTVSPGAVIPGSTHQFTVNCTTPSQICSPAFSVPLNVPQPVNVLVQYTVAALHCSPVRVTFSVDGASRLTTPFIGTPLPGRTTGVLDLGPIAAGAHALSLQAEGQTAGCNSGFLESWGGELAINYRP
jgi:hypothetical protein